jgi:ribose 5-phosphate isomerase RpiB
MLVCWYGISVSKAALKFKKVVATLEREAYSSLAIYCVNTFEVLQK